MLKSTHVAYFIERGYASGVKQETEAKQRESSILFKRYTLRKKHSHFVKVFHVIAIHLSTSCRIFPEEITPRLMLEIPQGVKSQRYSAFNIN